MTGAGEDFEAARLTVRLGAIVANYRTYCRMTGPCAVAAVVKADAYGMGAAAVAPALAGAGCDTFFVARLAEGVALRGILPQARIIVLDGAQADAVPALLTHRLIPALNSLSDIAAWSAAANAARTTLDAVIHVDTGMTRLGLAGDEPSGLRRRSQPDECAAIVALQTGAGDAAARARQPGRQPWRVSGHGISLRPGAARRGAVRRQSAEYGAKPDAAGRHSDWKSAANPRN
jgi:hypothetical protein